MDHPASPPPLALVGPLSRKPLTRQRDRYVSADGVEAYAIAGGGVAVFTHDGRGGELPLVASTARVHRDAGTAFDYRAHYARDADYFDYFEAPASAAERFELRRLREAIVGLLPRGGIVADVGCGGGWLAGALHGRAGLALWSCDVSVTNPAGALARYPSPRHRGLAADAYHLPFAEASLDAIVAAEIIEHVPDPRLFVERLCRHLRPGGRLVVTTPYAEARVHHLCVHCDRPTPSNAHLHTFHEGNVDRLRPPGTRLLTERLANNYLLKARTHAVFAGLSQRAWRRVDRWATRVAGRPLRYVLVFERER